MPGSGCPAESLTATLPSLLRPTICPAATSAGMMQTVLEPRQDDDDEASKCHGDSNTFSELARTATKSQWKHELPNAKNAPQPEK